MFMRRTAPSVAAAIMALAMNLQGSPSTPGGQTPERSDYGQDWTTSRPGGRVDDANGRAAAGGAAEHLVTRLEKITFGYTYPEHELVDRVDHLDIELFGAKGAGSLAQRLAAIEQKLSGSGIFASQAQPAPAWAQTDRSSTADPENPPHMAASGRVPDRNGDAIGQGLRRSEWISADDQKGGYQSPVAAQPTGQSATTYDTYRRAYSGLTSPAAPSQVRTYAQEKATGKSKTYDARQVAASIPYDRQAGDYFNQIRLSPGGTIARWTEFPVRLHLPEGSASSWQSNLDRAVREWGRYIPLETASGNVNIDVSWVDDLPPDKLGITRVRAANGTPSVSIYLLKPTYYPAAVPEKSLKGIFLHELGHAVGIWGHSSYPEDIMQAPEGIFTSGGKRSQVKFGKISRRDVNTLHRVYKTPPLPSTFTSPRPVDWSYDLEHK